MSESASFRLRAERERCGLSQRALAEKVGLSKNTQMAYESGASSISLDYLEKVAEHGLDPAYIALGDIARAGHSETSEECQEIVSSEADKLSIPMLELGYGMGGTFLDENNVGEQVEDFPAAFIRKFTRSPANLLAWADGIGDSMYPTIGDRDLLLVDRSNKRIVMNDQIWALASGEIGMIKRVRLADGRVHLMSDNPTVSDYAAGEDELSVIGRVVAVVRRI